MGDIVSMSEYRQSIRRDSAAMTVGLKAVSGMNENSFIHSHKDNYKAMYFCIKGTLREYRDLKRMVSKDPSVENMTALQNVAAILDEILDA